MSFMTIFIIALGLAMDAFAVSITSGITIKRMHLRHALIIATFFGIFQAIMPVFGWSIGYFAANLVSSFDHWIAFTLLVFIGGKMIYEAYHDDPNDEKHGNPLNIYILFTLAIATSIDAAAVGITLSFLNVSIIQPAVIIGVVTFLLSFAGTYIGNTFGDFFEKKIEFFGGLVLIGIGFKILIQHLFK